MSQRPNNALGTRLASLGRTAMAAIAALLMAPAWSSAQEQDPLPAFANKLSPDVLKQLGRSKEQYMQQAASQIFRYAPDGVLTKEVIDTAAQHHMATRRAKNLTPILSHDLNGDFQISRAEIEKQSHLINHSVKGQLALAFAEFDADGDDVLTVAELGAFLDSQTQKAFRRDQLEQYFAFDFNGDGRVDITEISIVTKAINPDILSTSAKRKTPSSAKLAARCEAPDVPKGHELVLLSGYEGPALSNISLNGQNRATTVATFIVEPGETPLYVFATAYDPIIWKFEGATDRIKRVVVQPLSTDYGPGAAVHGIDAKAVTFVAPRSCVGKHATKTGQRLNALTKELSAKLSTPVAYPVATYSLDHIQIPSGIAAKDQQAGRGRPYRHPVDFSIGDNSYRLNAEGMVVLDKDGNPKSAPNPDRRTIREMIRFYRGGLTAFDPKELVASAKVEPYVVLPDQAGLLQLIADGKIEVLENGHYRVKENIPHYPGGLAGAHSVTFVIAKGVDLPPGSPGHSMVILEETNTCIIGSRCP
ncbi:EF-hand domain-containing protein [Rhodobacteraceae bacterium B1Z28]|uniref:EF-hand domain-containing protein n=1 Tax=Ruegeria haliotis TaxID=2747601 RepID=A0ABX2PTK3_9RHOB|nr:EF-hand domain-containing protein [Ruegeria haliotis]NVO57461.1 EF-hand domain-containing protein [Ruegeria haliotis]